MKKFLQRLEELQVARSKSNDIGLNFDALPGVYDLTYDGLGGVLYLAKSTGYNGYTGNLTELDFQKYKKDIKALFEDFDEIFSKINTRYGLKPTRADKEKA